MNRFLLAFFAALAVSTPAAACPYAGGSYVAQFTNDTASRAAYSFNEDCTEVRLSRPTNLKKFYRMRLVKVGDEYHATGGQTSFRFSGDGRFAAATRGGRNLTARLRALKK